MIKPLFNVKVSLFEEYQNSLKPDDLLPTSDHCAKYLFETNFFYYSTVKTSYSVSLQYHVADDLL